MVSATPRDVVFGLRGVALVLLALTGAGLARAQGPEVVIDPRVELLSLVFRLAGNPEYNMCRFPRYQAAADQWFAPWREHRAVALARESRTRAGVGFDAVQSMAIHLGPPPALVSRVSLTDTASTLGGRWRRVDAEAFVAALREFAAESRFMDFMAANRPLADSVASRLDALFAEQVDFGWFERFFGARPSARFLLVPGLCNGAGNFGPRIRTSDGREELYAIISVSNPDSAGVPTFSTRMVSTIVHEFNHSYVNPVFDAAYSQFSAAAGAIYPLVAEDMRAQAYGNPLTMLNESMVRAGVVRYLAATRGDSAARSEIEQQVGIGFVWMGELSERLAAYERARDRYPRLTDFVPRLAAYWDSLVPRVEGMLADLERRRPRLVAMTPAEGDSAVDPATSALRLWFDRPMRDGFSINPGRGGDGTFPTIGTLAWDSSRTVLTIQVTLAAGRSYELVLSGNGFRSQEGVPLRRRMVSFRTRQQQR